jgi:hypothetical protein
LQACKTTAETASSTKDVGPAAPPSSPAEFERGMLAGLHIPFKTYKGKTSSGDFCRLDLTEIKGGDCFNIVVSKVDAPLNTLQEGQLIDAATVCPNAATADECSRRSSVDGNQLQIDSKFTATVSQFSEAQLIWNAATGSFTKLTVYQGGSFLSSFFACNSLRTKIFLNRAAIACGELK